MTALALIPGCKGDDARSRTGKVTMPSTRASRVSQRIVGESPDSEGESRALAVSDNQTLRLSGVDAAVIQIEPIKARVPLEFDAVSTRELSGVVLDAEWKQSDLPAPAGAPETSNEALEELRSKTRLRMKIEIAASGRMRIAFLGLGYPWPEGTEIRARVDKFGHILVWPSGAAYRNVVTGSLRALFADRRLDMGPLFVPKVAALSAGAWLGQSTSRRILTTQVAEMQIDQATVAGTGLGAVLLCRFLVELAGAEPSNSICSSDQLPLHAQLTNAPGGKLGFSVTQIVRKQELAASVLQVPPEHCNFELQGMPVVPSGTAIRSYLSGMRLRPSAVQGSVNQGGISPGSGLVASNRALSLRALLVDGIVVGWLAPGTELSLPELRPGVYSMGWRDFFGSSIEPSRNVTMPARVAIGGAQESAN